MGPAQGAHSKPQATPSSSDEVTPGGPPVLADADRRAPAATSGRVSQADRPGQSSVRLNTAARASPTPRPNWLADSIQPPPSVATAPVNEKASTMPISNGRPLRTNGAPVRENTKGRTGRMQGLTIVSTPPR